MICDRRSGVCRSDSKDKQEPAASVSGIDPAVANNIVLAMFGYIESNEMGNYSRILQNVRKGSGIACLTALAVYLSIKIE